MPMLESQKTTSQLLCCKELGWKLLCLDEPVLVSTLFQFVEKRVKHGDDNEHNDGACNESTHDSGSH